MAGEWAVMLVVYLVEMLVVSKAERMVGRLVMMMVEMLAATMEKK